MRRITIGAAVFVVACSSSTEPRLGTEFTLRVGDRATVADIGVWVRFVEVAGDSRCPLNAFCVWAGDAEVVVETAHLGGQPRLDTLHTALQSQLLQFGDFELRLIRLEPYPEAPDTIPADAYAATLTTKAQQ